MDYLNGFHPENLKTLLPALLAFVISLVVLRTAVYFLRRKLHAFAKSAPNNLDDTLNVAASTLNFPFYFTLSIYIALFFVELQAPWKDRINAVIYVVAAFYIIRLTQTFTVYSIERAFAKKSQNIGGGLKIAIVGALWLVGGAIVLQHFGYNVSTLVAGLGIGGIAIAFAMQSILADIFASFSIFFDQPFEIGDFIMIDDDQGTVKAIGIKSTRITTLQGEELVISNSELTNARIRNFKQMEERRAVLNIGVIYETPVEKLELAKKIISDAITTEEHLRLDRLHLKTLAPGSIVFEAVFFVDTRDYLVYADANERINLTLLNHFNQEGIEFAYPTQKVFLTNM